jgi:hypothetical protein
LFFLPKLSKVADGEKDYRISPQPNRPRLARRTGITVKIVKLYVDELIGKVLKDYPYYPVAVDCPSML